MSESKYKIIRGLDHLLYKYSNTTNPQDKYTKEKDSPTNLEINRQNIAAAANFKNKIKNDVPSNHVTPESSDVDDDNDDVE